MFTTVEVPQEVELPHWPDELKQPVSWQSKRGLDRYSGPYRITEDGRLEKRQVTHREKTDEEKQAEAKKWGYNSWQAYYDAYEELDGDLYPYRVKMTDTVLDESPPTVPGEQTVDEEWWGDCSMHGTFEFHQYIKRDPQDVEVIESPIDSGEPYEHPTDYKLEVYLQYEAQFTRGDLDKIVFQGERGFHEGDDPVESAKEKLNEWREWNNDN
jgi:hypothetical protein